MSKVWVKPDQPQGCPWDQIQTHQSLIPCVIEEAYEVADAIRKEDEEALIDILSKPKNALTKQYQKLFEMEKVKLEFREEALRSIALKAIERKTGARGLRSILETILLDSMFDLPDMDDVEEIIINSEVVENGNKPISVHSERREDIETSA